MTVMESDTSVAVLENDARVTRRRSGLRNECDSNGEWYRYA